MINFVFCGIVSGLGKSFAEMIVEVKAKIAAEKAAMKR